MKKILYIAHRGGGSGVFENKIETIKNTLKNELIDALEVDIRKTKDDIIVLSHDRGVKLNGKNIWIDEVNYSQIKHLGIAALEEILPLFKNSNKILDLDIKDKNTVSCIVKTLKKNNYSKKIFFSSFDLSTLFQIQEEFSNGQYFLSSSIKDSRDFFQKRIFRIIMVFCLILLSRVAIFILKKRFKKIKLDGISLFYRFAAEDFISDLKAFGFKVFIWGTDKEKEIKKMLGRNIDGIKTKDVKIFNKITASS